MLDLCLTLAQKSSLELANQINEFAGSVPLIEIRLDRLSVLDVPDLPGDSETQFLATCRPLRQGGHYDGPEEDRLGLLRAAAEQGFQWVDLENDVSSELRLPQGTSVVRSFHSFQQFPANLDSVLQDLRARGGREPGPLRQERQDADRQGL